MQLQSEVYWLLQCSATRTAAAAACITGCCITFSPQAVIGAGASGLVAARELRREGHEVVVFEQQAQLGGTWVYTDKVRAKPFS